MFFKVEVRTNFMYCHWIILNNFSRYANILKCKITAHNIFFSFTYFGDIIFTYFLSTQKLTDSTWLNQTWRHLKIMLLWICWMFTNNFLCIPLWNGIKYKHGVISFMCTINFVTRIANINNEIHKIFPSLSNSWGYY